MTFRPFPWLRLGFLTLPRRAQSRLARSRLAVISLALPPLVLAVAQGAGAREVTVAEPAVRYPFDPVCPWGRIADGRGMLVRCLEPAEAQRLAAPARVAPAPVGVGPAITAPAAAPPPVSPLVAPTTTPAEPRAARAMDAPSLSASVPAARPAPAPVAPSPPPVPAGKPRKVVLEAVSAARADTGELPEARTQLLRARDRYVQCVESNGGISTSPARVTLRFLVRERGRAEGVTVKERAGLSMAAAKCIATVVDRRYVGYPAAPIVGADLSVDFAWEAGR
jgi:hypothetical protein